MKKTILLFGMMAFFSSCGIFGGGSNGGTNCPMQKGAMDAKRIAEGDPKAIKESKKLKKFKYGN